MAKVIVAELEGPVLDWAVAKYEGMIPKDVIYSRPIAEYSFHPSTDWAQGGPIIEREEIQIGRSHTSKQWVKQWVANTLESGHAWIGGPTPLVAAMRTFVRSKCKDAFIEVPDELLQEPDLTEIQHPRG